MSKGGHFLARQPCCVIHETCDGVSAERAFYHNGMSAERAVCLHI